MSFFDAPMIYLLQESVDIQIDYLNVLKKAYAT